MRIRKVGGTVATLALVSVFVFGGIEVAHAAGITLAPFDSSGATNASLHSTSQPKIHGTADADASITVTASNSEASDVIYCTTVADPLGSWSCPTGADVHLGTNIFTATDGTSSVTSSAIMIYGTDGPSLISPRAGSSIVPYSPTFSGYGPARGSVSVYATTGGSALCTVATVPDSGEWSCHSSVTLPEGSSGFSVTSSTPGSPSDSFYSQSSNPVTVTVSQLTPPSVSYVMGYATGSSTATTSFDDAPLHTALYSVTEPAGAGNGYQDSPYPQKSCDPATASDVTGTWFCDFGALDPGIWKVSSYQTLGEAQSGAQNDFFRIPETPTMMATAQPNQTVAFSGSGTNGDLVSVIATGGSDGGTTVCTATVAGGAWSCTAAATPGSHSYHASQLDQVWTPYPDSDNAANVDGAPLGVVLDGRSALTQTTTVTVAAAPATPAAPTMSYVMGYATGSSLATGPDGALIHTELYSVTEPEGPGNGYSFDSPVLGCYPDSEIDGTMGAASTAESTAQPTVQPCDFGTLAPGIWNVYSGQNVDGVNSPYQNDFFRIPAAPTLSATGHPDGTVSFSGTGTTGDLVSVIADGGSAVCSGTVVAGAWSCSAPAASGSHDYRAYQLDQGWKPYTDDSGNVGNAPLGIVLDGKSALTAPAATIIPGTTPAPTATPTATPTPQGILSWLLTITGMNGPLHPGDVVTLGSSGLPAGSTVTLFLHSAPISLGSVVVAQNGSFSKTVVIPEGVEPGDHHFVATLITAGSAPSTVESPVTIAAPEQLPTLSLPQSSQPTADAAAGGTKKTGPASPGTPDNRNTLSTPSSFTNALPTLAKLFENPATLAVAAGFALAILLLAALPTELLDSAVSSNLDRFGPLLARAGSWAERATAWLDRVTHGEAVSSAIMIVLSAVIFGFADPRYGFNLVSLRLTLSIVVGLFVVYYIAPRISGRILRSRWNLTSGISIQPIALVFAIIGVVIGRLLGFSPGFLIGMAIGLELASNAKTLHKARSMAVQVAVIVGLALLAWLGYSLVAAGIGSGAGSVWTRFVQDTLSTVTAEGLTGMLLGLFPLAFFEGKEVWEYSKWLWATLFLVTGTAFALLVLPTAVAPEKIGESLPVWLLVLGCFTVLSVGLWLYLKLTTKPELDAAEPEPERIEA